MAGTVTYGDLIRAVDRDLAAAQRSRSGVRDYPGILTQLHRFLMVLARHLEIATPPPAAVGIVGEAGCRRTAAELREALYLAADRIAEAAAESTAGRAGTTESHCIRHLRSAVEGVAVTADLVRTHQRPDGDGVLIDRSDWARIARSPQVGSAVVEEATRHSGKIRSWLDWLTTNATATARLPHDARLSVTAASGWLDVAASLVPDDPPADSHRTAGRELLHAIPLWHVPDRVAPRGGESAAERCAGIAGTADRLRAIAFAAPHQAACASPDISGPAWRRTAWKAAIVSDLCAGTLAKLAQRAHLADTPGIDAAGFDQAIATLNASCAAWRQAANMWQVMTTDTQKTLTPAAAEVHDLLLRVGRLAHASPDWIPATESRIPWRTPSALAPDKAAFLSILAAIHQAADALSRMAAADLEAIGVLGYAGRFYMPNNILWDDHAPTRNYAYAPHDRIALLADVHQVVAGAGRAAAEALDQLVLEAGTPTRILALARQSLPAQQIGKQTPDLAELKSRLTYFTRPRHIRIPDATPINPEGEQPEPTEPREPEQPQSPAKPVRGPVEETIRAASVTDPTLLIQAAAIDRAASQLVKRAVSLAAQDTPNDPALTQQPRLEDRRDPRPSGGRRNRSRRPG